MSNNFLISLRDYNAKGEPGTKMGDKATYFDLGERQNLYFLQEQIAQKTWLDRLRLAGPSVMVFVHGFGDDSVKVVERHHSIKPHLPDGMSLVSFDWPAGNLIKPYETDKANAALSAPKLMDDCLSVLLANKLFDAANIHLFAHSMGAYVTGTAFQLGRDVKINHVLMAAADVDRGYYVNGSVFLANFLGTCADLTAYWSTEDAALQDSARMNNYIPLGLRGYQDPDMPNKHSLQCTDYYNVYVKPDNPGDEFSHVWYLLFQPTQAPPLANDFYTDMKEVLHGSSPKLPTRALHHMLKAKAQASG